MIDLTGPAYEIVAIALAIALISSAVTKVTVGKKNAETIKKTKELQSQLKSAMKQKNIEKAKELQSEMLKVSMESIQNSFKPMLITIIPFILVFWWMASAYGEYGSVSYKITIENTTPVYVDFYNGTLKARESINFSLKIFPENIANQQEINTKVITTSKEGSISAILNTVFNANDVNALPKNAVGYEEIGEPLDVSPKYQSKSTNGEPVNYTLTITNKKSDAIVNIFGIELNWLWWYMITVVIFSMIIGKLFKNY